MSIMGNVKSVCFGLSLGAGLLFATGCSSSGSDDNTRQASLEIVSAAPASEATERDTGIVRWEVAKDAALRSVEIAGFDRNDTELERVVMHSEGRETVLAIDGESLHLDSAGKWSDSMSEVSALLLEHLSADLKSQLPAPAVATPATSGGTENVGQASQALLGTSILSTGSCALCWLVTVGTAPAFCYKSGMCA